MSKNRGKLTATDVLALINSADGPSSPDAACAARKALRKAVDLGESVFFDQATFSAAQRILIALPKPLAEQPLQMTPHQMRAARVLLGWSRERLAVMSEATANFVKCYEEEGRAMKIVSRDRMFDPLAAIRVTLIEHGVEFTNC